MIGDAGEVVLLVARIFNRDARADLQVGQRANKHLPLRRPTTKGNEVLNEVPKPQAVAGGDSREHKHRGNKSAPGWSRVVGIDRALGWGEVGHDKCLPSAARQLGLMEERTIEDRAACISE